MHVRVLILIERGFNQTPQNPSGYGPAYYYYYIQSTVRERDTKRDKFVVILPSYLEDQV